MNVTSKESENTANFGQAENTELSEKSEMLEKI